MTKTAPPSLAIDVESKGVETMDTVKLMRFCQLIIELDNKRLAAEAERKEQEK